MDSMFIPILLFVLFLVLTLSFVGIAVFFPEWVGITGKKAQDVEKSHRE